MSEIFKVKDAVFKGGTHIMGILNATPDSFFFGSRVGDDAVEKARKMLDQGAEIIDIGGQSTAPGAKPISALEEMSRTLPIVEDLRREFPSAILSVDTFYPEVADACLSAGADMINDVTGLKDREVAKIVARHGASVCIMHNRRGSKVKDMWLDKQAGLLNSVNVALDEGIDENKILLDGGIGFNLSRDEDVELLKNYGRLGYFGYPLLLGTSRKSFLGGEPETRLTATLETTAYAKKIGVLFVRVHDVKENKYMLED